MKSIKKNSCDRANLVLFHETDDFYLIISIHFTQFSTFQTVSLGLYQVWWDKIPDSWNVRCQECWVPAGVFLLGRPSQHQPVIAINFGGNYNSSSSVLMFDFYLSTFNNYEKSLIAFNTES